MAPNGLYQNYVNGGWVSASTGKVSQSINPADLDDVDRRVSGIKFGGCGKRGEARHLMLVGLGVRCRLWRAAATSCQRRTT